MIGRPLLESMHRIRGNHACLLAPFDNLLASERERVEVRFDYVHENFLPKTNANSDLRAADSMGGPVHRSGRPKMDRENENS